MLGEKPGRDTFVLLQPEPSVQPFQGRENFRLARNDVMFVDTGKSSCSSGALPSRRATVWLTRRGG
jgi:hypothetical protein